MEQNAPAGTRRTEDIALDLFKFVAAHANVARPAATSTPGFAPSASSKPEDAVTHLLDLYARCREAVESPAKK